MTTLVQLRSAVHAQTQTTDADLPDTLIDVFLEQGFWRTIGAETRWPFYESQWTLAQAIGESSITLPGDVNVPGIMSVYDLEAGWRLSEIDEAQAEDLYQFEAVSGSVVQFSIWGNVLTPWPKIAPEAERSYQLRGYRRPVTWLTGLSEPDCDSRLHVPFTHYATALAYAQQEDDQLEAVYMERWSRDVETARRAIMDPHHHRPLAFAGSIDAPTSMQGRGWRLAAP
jgi:hypothetical protein